MDDISKHCNSKSKAFKREMKIRIIIIAPEGSFLYLTCSIHSPESFAQVMYCQILDFISGWMSVQNMQGEYIKLKNFEGQEQLWMHDFRYENSTSSRYTCLCGDVLIVLAHCLQQRLNRNINKKQQIIRLLLEEKLTQYFYMFIYVIFYSIHCQGSHSKWPYSNKCEPIEYCRSLKSCIAWPVALPSCYSYTWWWCWWGVNAINCI